jgi:ERCC4-related helicase
VKLASNEKRIPLCLARRQSFTWNIGRFKTTKQQGLIASSLLRSLLSSPAALESQLEKIAVITSRAIHGMDSVLGFSEEDTPEDERRQWLDLLTVEKVSEIAAQAVEEIETIGSDSKLVAFSGLIGRFSETMIPLPRVCVLTKYLSTLYYVAAEIEIRGQACRLFHGGMSAEDRQSALALFCDSGGVLAATIAAMSEGVALGEVTDLVLYDFPSSRAALEQVLSRFDQFGRRTQLNVHVLVPSNGVDGSVTEALGLLHQLLGVANGS